MISQCYPIWSNVLSFLPEIDKLRLKSLDSFTLDIINNSFNLHDLLGRWRYANKKLGYLSRDSFDLKNECIIDKSFYPQFIEFWGITCQLILIESNCYLKVWSLLGNQNYYFITQITQHETSHQRWIHSLLSYNTTQMNRLTSFIYHFENLSVEFSVDKNFDFVFHIMDHSQKSLSITRTDEIFIKCDDCKNISRPTRFDNESANFFSNAATISLSNLEFDMYKNNYVMSFEDFTNRLHRIYILFSNAKMIELNLPFSSPTDDFSFNNGSYIKIEDGYCCVMEHHHSQNYYQIITQKNQHIKFCGPRMFCCHFFQDLEVGFAYNVCESKLQILNQFGNLTEFWFDIEIKLLGGICDYTHSFFVITNAINKINLMPFLFNK